MNTQEMYYVNKLRNLNLKFKTRSEINSHTMSKPNGRYT